MLAYAYVSGMSTPRLWVSSKGTGASVCPTHLRTGAGEARRRLVVPRDMHREIQRAQAEAKRVVGMGRRDTSRVRMT